MTGKEARQARTGDGSPETGYFDFNPDMSTIKKSAANSLLIQLILKLKSVITMPVFTYFITPGEMGIYNIISVSASLLTPLFTLNLPDGSVLFFAQEGSQQRIRRMYMTVLHSVVLFSLALGLIAFPLIALIRPEMLPTAGWVGLVISSTVLYKLAEFLLVTFQKTDLVLKNAFIRDLGTAVFSVGLVALGLSYRGLLVSGAVFMFVMALALFRKIFQNLRYSFLIDRPELMRFLRTSIPLLPVFFFSWIIQSSDSYFLLRFRGEEVVGKYGVVYGLCNTILVLTFALNFFWFPVSARLWARDREHYRKVFISVFSGFCLLLALAVLLFELNAGLILRIFARNEGYQDAYPIIGTIAFAFAVQVLITLLTAPLYSNGNSKLIFASYLAGGILNTVLNIVLIPGSGIMGAALSTAFSYLLVALGMSVFNYRTARFSFLDPRLIPAGLAFLAAWGGIIALRPSLNIPQILGLDLGLVVVFGTLVYFAAMTSGERAELRSIIKSLVRK